MSEIYTWIFIDLFYLKYPRTNTLVTFKIFCAIIWKALWTKKKSFGILKKGNILFNVLNESSHWNSLVNLQWNISLDCEIKRLVASLLWKYRMMFVCSNTNSCIVCILISKPLLSIIIYVNYARLHNQRQYRNTNPFVKKIQVNFIFNKTYFKRK